MSAQSEPLPLDQVLGRIADVLVKLWPPERVILGMGTCKVVREILQHAPRAVLSLHPAELDRSWATFLRARDLARFNGLVDIVVRTPQQCKMIAAGIERATRIAWKGPTVLTFSDCLLGEDGAMLLASLLAQCTRLHELDLQGSYIGPTGSGFLAKSLRRLTNLRSLKLGHNELEAQGMKRLAAALTSLPSLTHLDVRSNEIGPGGSKHLACCLALLPALSHLSVSDNLLGLRGLTHLLSPPGGAPVANERVAGGGDQVGGSEQVSPAAHIAALASENDAGIWWRRLEYFGANNNELNDDAIKSLALTFTKAPNLPLVHVDLSSNQIADAGATFLSLAFPALSALQTLDLRMNDISAAGAAALAAALPKMEAIKEVDLAFNNLGAAGATAICMRLSNRDGCTRLLSLRLLDISGNNIGRSGHAAILSARALFPHLRLSGDDEVPSEGLPMNVSSDSDTDA